MGTSRLSTLFFSFLLIMGLLQALPAFGSAVPVIVAIDTSRSLTPSQLGATTEILAQALAGLPEDTPTGLVAFDDAPRWVRPPGSLPSEVLSALGELTPQGDFTLMHDAVFLAIRDMPEGGVIVLATDGRDESSATTVEDVATRCNDLGVRLVTVGSGGNIDERTLRRLALLTGGVYVGRNGSDEAGPLAGQILAVAGEIGMSRPAQAAVAEAAVDAEAPLADTREPAALPQRVETEGSGAPTWALGAIGLLVLFALVLFLRARSRKAVMALCDHCGSELDVDGGCEHCQEADTVEKLLRVGTARRDELREVTAETEAFSPLSFEESLEHTCVLEEQIVLVVREPGQGPRIYSIPQGRAISIGRDSGTNTLALPDPTLSTRHLRIVPSGGLVYLLDCGSTNGCLLNGRRTKIAIVKPGDVLKAGQIELAVKTRQHRLDWDTAVAQEAEG